MRIRLKLAVVDKVIANLCVTWPFTRFRLKGDACEGRVTSCVDHFALKHDLIQNIWTDDVCRLINTLIFQMRNPDPGYPRYSVKKVFVFGRGMFLGRGSLLRGGNGSIWCV